MRVALLLCVCFLIAACSSNAEEQAYNREYNENRKMGEPERVTMEEYRERATGKNKYERAITRGVEDNERKFLDVFTRSLVRAVD